MADRTHPGEIGSASGACCSTRKAAAAPEARSELVRPCCVVQGLRRAASSVDQPKEERKAKSGRSSRAAAAAARAVQGAVRQRLVCCCSPNVSKQDVGSRSCELCADKQLSSFAPPSVWCLLACRVQRFVLQTAPWHACVSRATYPPPQQQQRSDGRGDRTVQQFVVNAAGVGQHLIG